MVGKINTGQISLPKLPRSRTVLPQQDRNYKTILAKAGTTTLSDNQKRGNIRKRITGKIIKNQASVVEGYD